MTLLEEHYTDLKEKYEKLQKDFEEIKKDNSRLIDKNIHLISNNRKLEEKSKKYEIFEKFKEAKKPDKGQYLANIAFLDGMQTAIDILKKCGAWDIVLNGVNDDKT